MTDRNDLPPMEDDDSGFMGLTEVDPSPVEETPVEYRENSYFPDQGAEGDSPKPRSTHDVGLRLGDHGPVWWRTFTEQSRRIQ